jgi:hypothetical protein
MPGGEMKLLFERDDCAIVVESKIPTMKRNDNGVLRE